MLQEQEPEDPALVSSRIWESFAFCLVNVPSIDVVRAGCTLESLLPEEEVSFSISNHLAEIEKDASAIATLQQRYYDRLFVPSSATHLPLTERKVRRATKAKGRWHFDPTGSSFATDVLQAYKRAGFAYENLTCYDSFKNIATPDNIAIEASFMAFLRMKEARAAHEEDKSFYRTCASSFLASHINQWAVKLAEIAASTDEDFYAKTLLLLARWSELDAL